METVTQKNASLVDESTASLASVDQQAEQMLRLISFFKTEARGKTATAPAKAQANLLQDRLQREFPAGDPAQSQRQPAPARPLRSQPKAPASGAAADWSEF